MTSDDIIRMAREAAARHGHTLKEQPEPETVEFITELAAMAAAAEREACAQVCEAYALRTRGYLDDDMTAVTNANAIRARSNK